MRSLLIFLLSQTATNFAICTPEIDLTSFIAEKAVKTTPTGDYVERLYPSIESYSGALPGVTDQPSCTFVFPPPDSAAYTWPLEKEKRIQWVSFNFPPDTKVKLNLVRETEKISNMAVADLDNDFEEMITMAADVKIGVGYSILLCADVGKGEACWKSCLFSVVAKARLCGCKA